MPAILMVDDDLEAGVAVRLALAPIADVHLVHTLAEALGFLSTRASEVAGVIVDLNLTDGSDQFGRQILGLLRDMAVPCVVFSSSIRSETDAVRYRNEFGVLGAVKRGQGAHESITTELRCCVQLMIDASTSQLRGTLRASLLLACEVGEADVDRERRRGDQLVNDARRIAGRKAGEKLRATEELRIALLREKLAVHRRRVSLLIDEASSLEDLATISVDAALDS